MHSSSVIHELKATGALPALEANRQLAFARGRQRWGEFGLSLEQFQAHLARLGWNLSLPSRVEELYLCAACRLGIEPACDALERTYFPPLRSSLRQLYACRDFVEEALQLARERLLVAPSVRIASYRGDGCLSNWLRRVVRRLAIDLCRAERGRRRMALAERERLHAARTAGEWFTDVGGSLPLAEAWMADLEGAVFSAIASLGRSESELLHAYYVKETQVDQIAAESNVDRSTVYRRLRDAERRLKRSIRNTLRARAPRFAAAELDAWIGASYSQLGIDSSIWGALPR